ncbi:MAG: single-stranded-DNA-specific exonuclease RecJ [Clostridia bacterium]|nr:single-stranded-DNA-specific exonuclease RecJ [Clostridia bacterium]
MYKKWKYQETDEKVVLDIAKKNNISNLLATVLVNRGITNQRDIEIFLNPTRKDFHDPYLIKDMNIAVDRIIKAINNKEKTIIYGDYDVDGITSITVLKKFLKERGLDVEYYIPNRLNEGYGLNKSAIDEISKKEYTLIITVDCGISAVDEIEYANSLGIETIVTDHHEPMEQLPKAIAVIDNKRKDSEYPFKNLAGVGVVFKLIQAIGMKLNINEKEYLKYLDIVCIGTISDIVPLVDENRVIAKLGLKLVEVTKNLGLRALINSSEYKVINSNTISFGIAPRINACGRMGFEKEAVKLFLTEDEKEAQEITEKLNKYNRDRQSIEKSIYEEAIQMIEKENLKDRNSIILGSDGWHHGVIGIVSSKITDMYFKPSILVCFEDDEAKGSGRSIPGFDLHEALGNMVPYIEKYGGHEMAIGLSLKRENFEKLREKFEEYVTEKDIKNILPIIEIDKIINLKDMNKETVEELELLEPFGEANKRPLFVYKNLKIDSIRALSEGKHLKLTLKDENTLINAIGFNLGHYSKEYTIGDKVDIAGMIELNSFNGIDNIQINIKDIMRSY